MSRRGAAWGCSLAAAAVLVVTTALIAEIAAAPTWHDGISSSTWTPSTSLTALAFGHGAFHGDLAVPSVLFGWLVIGAVLLLAGGLGLALIVYALGWRPHPLAAGLLGAAWGLATEIVLINLLLNWVQAENGVYRSLPSWGWWVGMTAWGTSLGLGLSVSSRRRNRSWAAPGGQGLSEHSPFGEALPARRPTPGVPG
jgi:hypothetical protein